MMLEYGCEQSHHRFECFFDIGSLAPYRGHNADALLLVLEETGAQPGIHIPGIYQQVGLEVVLEAAEVKICGAHSREIVINDYRFAVEHPFVVEIYLDACAQALLNIAERCPAQHVAVAAARKHDADIDFR